MAADTKTNVAVIGATGFTGEKLIELLLGHPRVTVSYISAKIDKECAFSEIFPHFKGRLDIICKNLDMEEAVSKAQVIFLALPHKISLEIAPFFLKKKKIVIDLSADYRFKDVAVYEQYYKTTHTDSANLRNAVYGLPEFYRDAIKKTQLVANPGCYPTVSILSTAPLLKAKLLENIIIDAKSGITGAGRHASLAYHFAHLHGNLFSYKPFGHQHLPEITQILSDIAKTKVQLRFSPHVIPAERGILATIHGQLTKAMDIKELNALYTQCYEHEPFVRFLGQQLPQLKDVIETNCCDIGLQTEGKNIVIVGTIDNLIKGASGQAIQNMNIICGWDETLGLL